MPEHTYLFKNESAKGFKSKERVTVFCCANIKGEKRDLLVIGKSKNPRCFKGVRSLPVDYYSNADAWMTSVIFNDWLSGILNESEKLSCWQTTARHTQTIRY
jgi:hypothetical protein